MEGPAFSTKAESNLYRSWNMDVIGMTNLQEAKLAREAEICYVTIAMVTDYDCWHEEHDAVAGDRHHPRAAAECRERLPGDRAGGENDAGRAHVQVRFGAAACADHGQGARARRPLFRSWNRLSASISCSDALAAIRRGERLPPAIDARAGRRTAGRFFPHHRRSRSPIRSIPRRPRLTKI